MRYGMHLAIAFLVIGPRVLPAQQERISLPPPDPLPAAAMMPPPNAFPASALQAIPPSQPSSPPAALTPTPPGANPYPPPGGYPYPPPGGYPYPPPAVNPYPPSGTNPPSSGTNPPPGGNPYPPPGGYPYPPPGGYPYPPPGGYPYPPPGGYPPPPPYAGRIINGDPVRNPNFWIGVDELLWWTKNQPLSTPVITTGPASAGNNPGGLGVPGTVSLNQPLNYNVDSGVRIFAGGWFDPAHTFGIDGSIFFLGQQNASFGAFDRSGLGNFVINQPVTGAPFSTLVSAPGIDTGSASVNATTNFWGADVNGRYNLVRSGGLTVNLLGGFRFLELDETLNIASNSSLFTTTTYTDNMGNVLATAPPGSSVTVFDHFGTRNQFYGGQIGAQFQYVADRWSVSGAGKVALGSTQEMVNVYGSTNVFPINGAPVSFNGGNFATLQSGQYATSRFAVAPEFNINLGYQFTPFLRGMLGYNFIYLSSVARPGNQIDNTYDGVTHPFVPMASSSFSAQGVTFSLLFSY